MLVPEGSPSKLYNLFVFTASALPLVTVRLVTSKVELFLSPFILPVTTIFPHPEINTIAKAINKKIFLLVMFLSNVIGPIVIEREYVFILDETQLSK